MNITIAYSQIDHVIYSTLGVHVAVFPVDSSVPRLILSEHCDPRVMVAEALCIGGKPLLNKPIIYSSSV
jgi:hypothetical protein